MFETDKVIQKADKYLSQEYFDNLRERQDQEYYLTLGMEHIKDLHKEFITSLEKRSNKVHECMVKIEELKNNDEPLREFDNAYERYSHYNPDADEEEILKHPRVMSKKPARDKYREQMRQLRVSMKIAQDAYSEELGRIRESVAELCDKFALYAAVTGSSETLETI